ncbi:hypothetical protein MuYL_0110 [Mucilaginibacter xinganensis]|uniref:Uncharacterized protein n=1 Tax=Mucilaginibacter xinganensis TaxID=1234841 RepID=A0A223NQ64_9SPHI|nr:hypothetical protein MuYL_0110 [Mucilaginibacter xinganensis]
MVRLIPHSDPNLPHASINFCLASGSSIYKGTYFTKLSKYCESLFSLLFVTFAGFRRQCNGIVC